MAGLPVLAVEAQPIGEDLGAEQSRHRGYFRAWVTVDFESIHSAKRGQLRHALLHHGAFEVRFDSCGIGIGLNKAEALAVFACEPLVSERAWL